MSQNKLLNKFLAFQLLETDSGKQKPHEEPVSPELSQGRDHSGSVRRQEVSTHGLGDEVEVGEGVQLQEEGVHHLLDGHVLWVFLFFCFLLRKQV